MLRAGLWHRGMLRAVSAETPPPGQDWAIQVPTVPEGVWWEVKSIVAQLVTSATVANRSVRWLFASQFNPTLGERISAAYFAASSPGTLAAASSRIFSAYQGAPAVNSVSDSTGLPIDNRVQPGHFILSLTGLIDPADQWKMCTLLVQEWVYEEAAQRQPSIGDGSGRVDTIDIGKLNDTLERMAQLLEAQQATP